MGACPITTLRIEIEDPCGGESGWAFTVAVPPIATVEKLHEILSPAKQALAALGARMAADADVLAAGGDLSDMASNQALREVVMSKYGAELTLGDSHSPTAQAQAAEAIEPHCSQPEGLEDDSGQPLTWQALRSINEPYAVSALYGAACEAYDRVWGDKGTARRKN